jgi:hypothetical protein
MRNTLLGILLVLLAVSFSGCQRAQGTAAKQVVEVATASPEATPKAAHYCNALTKKGTPCQHRVKADGDRCFMHQGKPPAPGYK